MRLAPRVRLTLGEPKTARIGPALGRLPGLYRPPESASRRGA
jgi:hypothetical protein